MFRSSRGRLLELLCVAATFGALELHSPVVCAQNSEIEREWRTLQDAQTAHSQGRAAALRGDRATTESELAKAADLYRALLQQNPLRKDLYAPLADTLIRRGNPAAAYALLSQQVRSGNRELNVQIQIVRALQGMRRHRHALEETQKLVQADPKNRLLQALLGEVAAEAGESELAIQMLGQALSGQLPKSALFETGIDPVELRLLRARLLLAAKRPAEAAAVVGELAKAQQPEGLLLLGQAQLDGGHAAEAIETLRRCLATTNGAAYRSRATPLLAQALARSGKVSEAIAALREAGDDPAVLLALAQLYLTDQPPNPPAALMVIERATRVEPRDLRLCIEHASLLERLQKTALSGTELTRCATLVLPTAPAALLELLTLRADVELRLGKLDDGIATLRSAIAKSPASPELLARLSRALLRRGLLALQPPAATAISPAGPTIAPASTALNDLEEARRLAVTPSTTQALAVGLLGAGRAREAGALLAPLVEKGATDARLLGAYGRALREIGQAAQALPFLQKAETLAINQPALKAALRYEQVTVLIALHRPLEALKLVDGNDSVAQRARAQAILAALRAYYGSAGAGGEAGKAGGKAGATRGPLPPLRGPFEQAILPIAANPGAAAANSRGTLPPLRGASEHPDLLPSGGTALPQMLTDEHQVLLYAQSALRAGVVLSPAERAEALLYQVAALVHGGQFEVALRLLGEISAKIDLPTLDSLLGPGGFADLKARVTLRGGDFYQGVGYAQQALPLLKPASARALQNTMAAAYTAKGIDLIERNEVERALTLLRTALLQSQGGPPEKVARAQYNLAVLQLYRGRLEEARVALGRLDPQVLPETWIGLGSYSDLSGDGRAALDAYRRYLQTSEPGDPQLARVRQWVDVLERVYEGGQP